MFYRLTISRSDGLLRNEMLEALDHQRDRGGRGEEGTTATQYHCEDHPCEQSTAFIREKQMLVTQPLHSAIEESCIDSTWASQYSNPSSPLLSQAKASLPPLVPVHWVTSTWRQITSSWYPFIVEPDQWIEGGCMCVPDDYDLSRSWLQASSSYRHSVHPHNVTHSTPSWVETGLEQKNNQHWCKNNFTTKFLIPAWSCLWQWRAPRWPRRQWQPMVCR